MHGTTCVGVYVYTCMYELLPQILYICICQSLKSGHLTYQDTYVVTIGFYVALYMHVHVYMNIFKPWINVYVHVHVPAWVCEDTWHDIIFNTASSSQASSSLLLCICLVCLLV